MKRTSSKSLAAIFAVASLACGSALAAPPKIQGAPSGWEDHYRHVIEAERDEEYEKALALLDQIPVEKQNIYTRLKHSGLLVRLGRFIEAEAILSALLKDPAADAIRATVLSDLDDVR